MDEGMEDNTYRYDPVLHLTPGVASASGHEIGWVLTLQPGESDAPRTDVALRVDGRAFPIESMVGTARELETGDWYLDRTEALGAVGGSFAGSETHYYVIETEGGFEVVRRTGGEGSSEVTVAGRSERVLTVGPGDMDRP